MSVRIASSQDVEVLTWLFCAPIGLCYTLFLLKGPSWWRDPGNVLFALGNAIFWALLLVSVNFTLVSVLLCNLTLFFTFLNTIGLYESARIENGASERGDILMFVYHAIGVVGTGLIAIKIGGKISCDVLSNSALFECSTHNRAWLWMALSVETLALGLAQTKGFFSTPLVLKDSPISKASPFTKIGDMASVFYLLVLLLIGVFA